MIELLTLSTSAIISLLCLILCLLLHVGSHFTFRQCVKARKARISHRTVPMLATKPPNTKKNANNNSGDNFMIHEELFRSRSFCQSCISPVDENFDFFPVSFVLYLMHIILLTAIIIYKLHMLPHNIMHHLFANFSSQMRSYDSLNFSIHSTHTHNMLDWILIYSMVFLSIWDSLFSFYRYYTTMYCAVNFSLLSVKTTLKHFCVYAIPYFIVYALHIHMYYYLYPLLIISHTIFNFWCNWMFCKILIDSTMQYTKTEIYSIDNGHSEMLESVYFMRRMSIFWCFISVSCQVLFVVTFNIEIIYFYPFLWCLGCGVFSLNFVRNRSRIYENCFKLYQICKHCILCHKCIKNIKNRKCTDTSTVLPVWNPQITPTTPDGDADEIDSNADKKSEGSIGNDMVSTPNSTDVELTKSDTKSGGAGTCTHTLMDSIDEKDEIGDIDVFEDEEEIIYSIYDDPVSIMALNRNSFINKRHSLLNTDNKHQLNTTLDSNELAQFQNMSMSMSMETDGDEYEEEEPQPISQTKTSKALDILGITADISKKRRSIFAKLNKLNMFDSNSTLTAPIFRSMMTKQRVRSLSNNDLPKPDANTLKPKHSKSTSKILPSHSKNWNALKLNLKPSQSENIHRTQCSDTIPIFQPSNKAHVHFNGVPEQKQDFNKFTMEITNKLEMLRCKSNASIVRRLEYQNQTRLPRGPLPTEKKMNSKRSLSEPNSPKKMQQFFGQITKNSPAEKRRSPDPDYIQIADNQKEINKVKFVNTMSEPIFRPIVRNEFVAKATGPKHRKTPSQGNTPIDMGKMVDFMGGSNKKLIDKHTKLANTLNVLVLQGFYSRKSLISHQQLTTYNKKGHTLKTIDE